MAATNYTPIQLYYSTTASAVPTAANLAQGELAINITDGKLFYEDNAGVVQVLATKGAGTIGGSNTQIQYNNAGALAGNAAMTFNSATSTTTLTTLNLTNALGAIYGGTAQSTYAQGDILYASAANTLSKLTIGAADYILTSTGSVVQWSAPTAITVATATNLAGGVAGSVPYQSAAATTTFLAIGAANRVMTSTGSAPQWVTSLSGLTGVSSSSITNSSLTVNRVVVSGTGGLQVDDADLTFDGTTLSAGGFSTVGLTNLVRTVKIGDSSFNGVAVFAAATPAKLYLGTGTVTDTTSAIGATNAVGAIASLGVTPIAATNTSVTYTNAATLYIAGAPSAGTNVTLTNPYALYVNGGASYFGGGITLDGGTANGVLYLNGSKVVTSGSALTFDGSNLGVTASSSAGFVGITTQNTSAGAGASSGLGINNDSTASTYLRTYGSGQTNTLLGSVIANYTALLSDGVASNGILFGTLTNKPIIFGQNNAEQMRLTSTGLGIGTTSPATKLAVASAVGTSGGLLTLTNTSAFANGNAIQIDFNGNNANGGMQTFAAINAYNQFAIGNNYGNIAFRVANAGSIATAMTLDYLGNLLLGTTTTTNNLRINESFAIVKAGNLVYPGMAITGYSGANTASRPILDFNKSRGTTDGVMTVVANNDILGSIIFRGADGTSFQDAAMISGWVNGTPGAGDMPGGLIFSITPDGSTTLADRMYLDAAGNLGLGVIPSAWRSNTPAFQIGSAGVCLFADSGITADVGNNAFLNSSSQYIYLRTDAASRYRQYQGVHSWLTAPSGTAGNAVSFSTAMTLTATGNLGLGTTSPSTNLQIGSVAASGGASGALGVFLSRGVTTNFYEAFDGTKSFIAGVDNTQGYAKVGTLSQHPVALVAGNGNGFLYLTTSGNLSLGTTTSLNSFNMPQASGGYGITWDNYGNVFGEFSSGATYISSNYYPTQGASGYKTTVTATYGAAGISINGTGGASNGGIIQFFVNPPTAKTAGAAFTPTEVACFTPNGLGLGGATPSSGIGITFPASQSASSDANTLDDYEEGTWTPTLFATGTAFSSPSFSGTARYVKIGKIVNVMIGGTFTFSGNGTGDFAISGLPFTVVTTTTTPSGGAAPLTRYVAWTGDYMTDHIRNGSTIIEFWGVSNGSTYLRVPCSGLTSGFEIYMSHYYEAAS